MKVLTIGSTVYLGELEEGTKGAITVKNALCISPATSVSKAHLAAYIKASNVGGLEKDIVIRGNGTTFSERELPDELALELQILNLKFKQAESLAVPELVNQKFTQLVG